MVAMSLTLPRLRQDHQNVGAVLEVIEAEIDIVAAGGRLNVSLIEAVILYFRQYFTRFHQTKEDLIFGHLVGQAVIFSKHIFPLVQDHRELLERVSAFERGIAGLRLDDPESRDDFCQQARRFIERQREHLAAEEKYFYPEAQRLLTAQQWAEVDSYLPDELDPLSRSPLDPAFAALVQAMPRSFSQKDAANSEQQNVREVVGIFRSSQDFQIAIDELLSAGFDRMDLSLLASAAAVDEKLGHRYEKVDALADDQSLPRAAYVSPEAIGDAEGGIIGALMYVGAITATGIVVASGGTLAALITAIVVAGGTGGAIGTILAKWIGSHHGHFLQDQLDRGGLLLWVRARDIAAEKRAVEILKKHSGLDVHAHVLPAV
jgi:hemerythrin-like domain-containing protein